MDLVIPLVERIDVLPGTIRILPRLNALCLAITGTETIEIEEPVRLRRRGVEGDRRIAVTIMRLASRAH